MTLYFPGEELVSINNFHLLNRYLGKRNHLVYINDLKYYLLDILPG